MSGLAAFAQGVVPGSARVISSAGDERNALLMLTVQTAGPDGARMTLPGARVHLLDDNGKIAVEKVVFCGGPGLRRLPAIARAAGAFTVPAGPAASQRSGATYVAK
jgi:hypothetical protein